MIDIHCHILPGLDDGSASLEMSLEMAAKAAACGIRTIAATPHCNTRNSRKNYQSPELNSDLARLKDCLLRCKIPVRTVCGAEVLLRSDFEEKMRRGLLPTLNNSRYLLCEFYFDEPYESMSEKLSRVKAHGLVPVIAHPERYYCIQENPMFAEEWTQKGYLLQANACSITGALGRNEQDTAELLLGWNCYSAVASDAHRPDGRISDMPEAAERLRLRFSADYVRLLFHGNPLAILENRRTVPPESLDI